MSILDLLTQTLLLRLRLVVYSILILLSFFIIVSVHFMKDLYELKCPLYSDISGRMLKDGKVSHCNYPMMVAVFFQLIYLVFRMAILLLLQMGKFKSDMFFFSNILELVYEVIDCIGFFLTFVGACILSAGTNSACDGEIKKQYCDNHADWITASEVAQAGAWISTFAWLFIAVVGFLTLKRAGRIPCLRGGAASASDEARQTATADNDML